MSKKTIFACVAILVMIATANLQADDDKIIIHGFGGWAFTSTDGYTYRFATEEGNWDFWDFALNINAFVTDDIRVNVQLYGDSFLQNDSIEVDYAFVEYSVNDEISVRAGKVKQPFGIYGESKKAGITRTFFDLPQSTYGHDLFTSDGYTGVGLLFNKYFENDWGVYVHAYAGSFEGNILFDNQPFIIQRLLYDLPIPGQPLKLTFNSTTDDVIGVYGYLETPFNGMKVGGSIVRGDLEVPGLIASEQRTLNGFVEYNNDPFLLRAEISNVDFTDDTTVWNFGYVEAGYKLTDKIQPVVRYEFAEPDFDLAEASIFYGAFPEAAESNEFAIGVNFFLSHELVVRASYHMIDGLLWATPQTVEGYAAPEKTNLFIIGTQFSF